MNYIPIFAISIAAIVAIAAVAILGLLSEDDVPEPKMAVEPEVLYEPNTSTDLGSEYRSDRPREWITSGPFQIDRSHYALGENIFFRVNQLSPDEKGQAAFLRPLNETHYSVFITFPIDGQKPSFNQYFTPDVNAQKNICNIDDIAGEWTIVFRGMNYDNIQFTISDSVFVPGEEHRFEPVC